MIERLISEPGKKSDGQSSGAGPPPRRRYRPACQDHHASHVAQLTDRGGDRLRGRGEREGGREGGGERERERERERE